MLQSEGGKEHAIDEDRYEREVSVVRRQEGARVVAAPVEHPRPLVEPERRAAGLVEEEEPDGDQERRERRPGERERAQARDARATGARRQARHGVHAARLTYTLPRPSRRTPTSNAR